MIGVGGFCSNLLFSFVGIGVTVWFVESLTGLNSGVAVFLTMPLLIAAMLEGQKFAKDEQSRPSVTESWLAALRMGLCVAALALCAFVLAWLGGSSFWSPVIATPSTTLFFGLACVPLLRIGYAIGLASVLKGQAATDY